MIDCIFCKIVAGEIPAKKIHEDDETLAFWDVAPQAPKHFLVIPKKHIADAVAMASEDEELMGKIIGHGTRLAQEHGIGSDFRVVINNGAGAGQTVFHLHVHFLGGRAMLWPPG
jgi:histidine triad (HIT) family protein